MPVQITNSESYTKTGKRPSFSLLRSLSDSVSNKQDRLILQLLLNTGITPTELCEIRNSDISGDMLQVQGRLLSLPYQLSKELQNFRSRKLFLFSTRQRPKLSKRAVHRLMEKYSNRWAMKVTTHDLRSAFAEECRNRISKKEINQVLGIQRLHKRKHHE